MMFIGVCQFQCRCGRALQTDNSGYVECSGCKRKFQVSLDDDNETGPGRYSAKEEK